MPNTHNVRVTPPAGTTKGTVDTNPVNPVGRNALIQFQFATGVTGWSFATTNPFQMKTTSPQPPAGMFTVTNNSPTTLVVQDANTDNVKYSYLLNLTKSDGTSGVIDPDIQNDSNSV